LARPAVFVEAERRASAEAERRAREARARSRAIVALARHDATKRATTTRRRDVPHIAMRDDDDDDAWSDDDAHRATLDDGDDGWGRAGARASTRDSWDDDDDDDDEDDGTTTTTTRDAARCSSEDDDDDDDDELMDDDALARPAVFVEAERRASAEAERRAREARARREEAEEEAEAEAEDDDEIDSDATDDEEAFDWRAVRANGDGNDGTTAREVEADAEASARRSATLPTRNLAKTQPWRARLPNFTPVRELPPQSFHDGELVFVDYEAQFGGPRSAASKAFARREARAFGGVGARDRAAASTAPTAAVPRWFTDERGRKTFVDARGKSLVGKAAYAASQRLRA